MLGGGKEGVFRMMRCFLNSVRHVVKSKCKWRFLRSFSLLPVISQRSEAMAVDRKTGQGA